MQNFTFSYDNGPDPNLKEPLKFTNNEFMITFECDKFNVRAKDQNSFIVTFNNAGAFVNDFNVRHILFKLVFPFKTSGYSHAIL